ncbi:FAD binding domain-containing protein [Colletotrichum higginsianum IMI 349063]|uniref:FAD binding domain-containing protein n=2 Tax=Colletotrichum higginsianum TaxID=80884 RepID=A0A1B7Y7C9_COLHI|nr:FAD binding domain-containing protein [Colletotrichum higginsianum IMI 349063]OBR07962.1 FAD binding domain-containing protein [Colletotrichum higginsianum IMI 349063]TIC91723.1 FAD-linked oxidoreductase apf9 [Colletotrichum higginsianum]GJC97942.1 FAD binding domain-containing protein [Colletotrichum higginsianum]
MQLTKTLSILAVLAAASQGQTLEERSLIEAFLPRCKSVPGDSSWPSDFSWKTLNLVTGGRLVKTTPVAQSCYDGPAKDLDECAYVTKMWSDQDFQTSNPIGRPYPYNITCAPVDYAAGETPSAPGCSLGPLPTYAVNATNRAHILSALLFARLHNVRLVVASTGHDLLGRSDGFGALEIWLRHYRNSIDFQETYSSANRCTRSGWAGSAIRIDGAWQWRDVYKVAKANNVIAVGGGAVSPGATGGWPSGGGHGPATRNYGLGADQILEAEVMLADGRVVTANHCENADLFRALRGGGPGYGIVLGTTIKAHPNVDVVTAHHLAIAPLFPPSANNSDLLDAVSVLLRSYPDLSDAGFAGYAYWFRNFPGVFVGNASSGYSHGFWTIGKTRDEADAGFAPVREALAAFRDRLFVHETFATYADYWSFYEAESGLYDPTGDTSILTSRLVDRSAVADPVAVREAVEVLSGRPEEFASNVVLLVSGGQVFEDAADETSGLHPAWRRSSYALITGRGIPRTAGRALRQAVQDDVTFVKGAAAKRLAPATGGYMNEGDRHDPDYIETFYGANYARHLAAKKKYDPFGVFYCPTCVGAEAFVERPDGPLCRV